MEQVLWFLLGLGLGLALDFLLVKAMLQSVKIRLSQLEWETKLLQEWVQDSEWFHHLRKQGKSQAKNK